MVIVRSCESLFGVMLAASADATGRGLAAGGAAVINRNNAQYARLRRRAREAGVTHIVTFGERYTLKKAISSSHALYRFFTMLEVQLKHAEDSGQ